MTTPLTTMEQPPPPVRRFVSSIVPADANSLALLSKLRAAFPELKWHGGERSSGGIHLAGESSEKPPSVGVHLLCKTQPGPFTLTIRLPPTDTASAEAEALKARVMKALAAGITAPPPPPSFEDIFGQLPPPEPPLISPQPMPLATVIHSIKLEGREVQLSSRADHPLPTGQEAAEPAAPKDFRFDATMEVPEVIEPSMIPRLRRAFPDLKWEDQAENWDKVRIWGTARETPERVVISVVRRESPGPFKLGITVSAKDEAAALKSLKETIDQLENALRGWSIFHLPQFKTRPPSGINIDQVDTVDLTVPVGRPQIRLIGPNAVILLSRSLLEALSTHGEILDSRAKEPNKYPGSNDEESRLASMRGARARSILKEAVPTGSGKDLEAQLALVCKSQFVASLVGELLENGLAQVVLQRPDGKSVPCPRINVHYFGSRAAPTVGFGFISYSGASSPAEFLRLNWWVS